MSKFTFLQRVWFWVAISITALGVFISFETSTGSSSQLMFLNSLGGSDSIYITAIKANDIVFNSSDGKIYMSIPGISGADGNSIRTLNPMSRQIGEPVFAGSEPNKLALSDDGHALYVALDGAFSIKRFITATMQSDLQFATGFESSGRYNVRDLAVPPGYWNIVAVARNLPVSPPGAGVAIFNNGVQAVQTTQGHSAGSDFLAFSSVGNTLYGTGQNSGLKTIAVTANGAAVVQSSSVGAGAPIKFSQGKIFTSTGQVVDPASHAILGQFPSANTIAFVPDTNGRAYYLIKESAPANTFTLKAFDINTYTLIGSLTVSGVAGDATRMIRWGANGLAFRTTSGQIAVLQTTLIPTPEPIPTPSATPATSPTPTPTPIERSVDYVNVFGNGLAYNQANGRLYMSIPSASGANGNSIGFVNVENASLESSVFVGSEPEKVRLNSDASKLYVYLGGARQIRVFDLVTGSPGSQFPVGFDESGSGPLRSVDFDVSPVSPNVIAVSRASAVSFPGYERVAIFDGGVMRPQTQGDSYSVSFSDSDSTLYGASSFAGGLEIMTVSASGISGPYVKTIFDGGTRIKFHAGRVYSSRGQVIDPTTRLITGTFPLGSAIVDNPRFVIVPEHNRILFLTENSRRIMAFELDTFQLIGSISVPLTGLVTAFERTVSNGVAISQSNGPLVLIRSALVNPAEPVAAPTPAPTPTPTLTPTPDSPFVRRINQLNNDILYNATDEMLYLSVPGEATNGTGNTITRINPHTGEKVSSVFIGSEPNRIALSENRQVLFAGLDVPNAIRIYDAASQTAGLQFENINQNNRRVSDFAPVPGLPLSVVVGTGDGGAAVYDNGVKRPNIVRDQNSVSVASIGPVEFSSTPGLLYGYNNTSTGFDLFRISIDPNGLNRLTSVRNLISDFVNSDMTFAEGRIYTSSGRVVNPETNAIEGTFQINSVFGNAIAVDAVLRKVFIAGSGSISVFDMDTYLKIGTIPYANDATPRRLVRWGINGLAMRMDGSLDYLYITQSRLVSTAVPIPTGLSFTAEGQTTFESNQGPPIFVTRSGDLSIRSTVDYLTTDGTAVAGQDYISTSGTLVFNPGESTKFLPVSIINDTIFENGVETFNIELRNPTGGSTQLVYPSLRTVSILDNDSSPRISGNDLSVQETGSGGTSIATVNVTLSNRSVLPVSVSYSTSSGTATAGTDFVSTNGVLTFDPLESVKSFPIVLIGDNIVEGNETLFVNLSSASNGSIIDPQIAVTIINHEPENNALFDYDSDGRADLSVYRPSDNIWYLLRGTAGYTSMGFGIAGDLIAPADYDNDGKTDVAVFRPSNGTWYFFNSATQSFSTAGWGQVGDLPVSADHDGDGKADLVVFRPSNSTWYTRFSSNNSFSAVAFGVAGDKPVVGDFDGDGRADIGVFRPSDNNWYVLRTTVGFSIHTWGQAGDVPVPADYDGDGKTDLAIFRPSTGQWFRNMSQAGLDVRSWGESLDKPVAADYDGDGKADIAVFRPSNGTWYLIGSTAGIIQSAFGQNGDLPTQGAFIY